MKHKFTTIPIEQWQSEAGAVAVKKQLGIRPDPKPRNTPTMFLQPGLGHSKLGTLLVFMPAGFDGPWKNAAGAVLDRESILRTYQVHLEPKPMLGRIAGHTSAPKALRSNWPALGAFDGDSRHRFAATRGGGRRIG